jgi:hypothetical protein
MRMLWGIGGWMSEPVSCNSWHHVEHGNNVSERFDEAVCIVVCCSAIRRGVS